MDKETLTEVIRQYERHGWTPRIFLTPSPQTTEVFGLSEEVGVESSKLNGIWFSRASRPGFETWELRRLEGPPFALLASVADDASDDERGEILKEVERRMLEKAD